MSDLLKPSNLYQYQKSIVNQVHNSNVKMLVVGMGLGKTISILSLIRTIKLYKKKQYSFLILAPIKVCQLVWTQERDSWTHTKGLTIAKLYGTPKQRQAALFGERCDVYLCNYEKVDWLSAQLEHYFVKNNEPFPFNAIVYDEVTKFKKHDSKRFKLWSKVAMQFELRYAMTGTPAPNGLKDLWAQYFLIDGGERLGKTYNRFTKEYFDTKVRKTKQKGMLRSFNEVIENDTTSERIANAVNDITMIFETKDYLDLPAVNYIPYNFILPPKLLKQYKVLEKDLSLSLTETSEVVVKNRMNLFFKLLQFSNGSLYSFPYPDDLTIRETNLIHKLKHEALFELIESLGDISVIIAYSFDFDKAPILLKYDDIECLTGQNESSAIRIVNDFNSGKLKKLLVHPASAGHGLNFQKQCSTIIWFGLTPDLDLWQQMNGRVNRHGQTDIVRIFVLLAEGTKDSKILTLLNKKKKIENDFLSDI